MARPARRSREVPSPPTTRTAVLRYGVLVGMVLAACVGVSAGGASAEIYWANGGDNGIGRAELDGSYVEQTFLRTQYPSGVAVSGTQLYWTTADYKVGRADLDGSHAGLILDSFARFGVAVDASHIYWAAGTSIGRANLDGSGASANFIADVKSACGVAVDGAHLYWGEADGGTVGRANLDGTGVNHGFITATYGPCDVAIDSAHVYWANWWDSGTTIGRAGLDGSNVNNSFITGATSPCGVAVDATHVYWGNQYGGGVGRANLDGSSVNQSFITTPYPCGVAVDALAGATTTLSSPGPIIYGQPVTFTAAVAARGSGPPLTGSVRFEINGAVAGPSAGLGGVGQASFTPADLVDVGDSIEAFYGGDGHYAPSRSGSLYQQIIPAHTATQLQVTPTHPVEGDDVIMLARVVNTETNVVPFGSVRFYINGMPTLGALALDDQGYAGILIYDVPAGSYRINVVYHDDTRQPADFADSETEASGGVDPTPTLTAAPPVVTPPPAPTLPAASASIVKPVTARGLQILIGGAVDALRRGGLARAAKQPQYFRSTIPGTLTEEIAYTPQVRSRALTPKTTTLAKGQHAFAAAGPGTLRLALTAAGRRAVRQHRALRVNVIARFVPRAGLPVSTSRSLRLKRS